MWPSFLLRGDISPTLYIKPLRAYIHFFHLVANELLGMLNKYIINKLWHSYWPTKVVSLILLILNMGLFIGSLLLYMGINLIFKVCHDLIIENTQHCFFNLIFWPLCDIPYSKFGISRMHLLEFYSPCWIFFLGTMIFSPTICILVAFFPYTTFR